MTFDIKKLSSALVIAALFSASVSADTPEVSTTEHDQAVLRATNVFYNLFATNALQAARAVVSGNLTTNNLFVEGNAQVDGSLVVTGTITSSGGLVLSGGETVVGPFTQTAGNVSISQDAAGVAPRSIAIGNTTATTGVTLTGGTTGLVRYQVGPTSTNNFILNPVGSAESAAQRMAWAQLAAAGTLTAGANSGITDSAATGTAGSYVVTWSNSFAAAPAIVASINGAGTAGFIQVTSGQLGATFATYALAGDGTLAGLAARAFAFHAIGK